MNLIPQEAQRLTDPASIALIKQIQFESIVSPLHRQSISTSYVQQGKKGKPLLLLHGFDSSILEFRRLLPLLANQYQTWAVDLLGFGLTERISGLSYGAEAIKTHLYYFWKTLIREPVILVGASMGGAAAIDFTLSYPEAIASLILIDSAGLANPPMAGNWMFPPLDYWATQFLRNPQVRKNISRAAYYDKSFVTEDAQLCAALHLNLANWSEALISFTKNGGYGCFIDQIKAIKQSTLILWGENDKILGTKDAYRFLQAIANSRLIWIKECGHVPHLEKPQITAENIFQRDN